MRYLWVALAGAAGAVTRYAIGIAFGAQLFPWATLGVNITGSFLLAFVLTFATERQLSPEVATAVTVGFIGAYTTFSTFAWESFVLGLDRWRPHRRVGRLSARAHRRVAVPANRSALASGVAGI